MKELNPIKSVTTEKTTNKGRQYSRGGIELGTINTTPLVERENKMLPTKDARERRTKLAFKNAIKLTKSFPILRVRILFWLAYGGSVSTRLLAYRCHASRGNTQETLRLMEQVGQVYGWYEPRQLGSNSLGFDHKWEVTDDGSTFLKKVIDSVGKDIFLKKTWQKVGQGKFYCYNCKAVTLHTITYANAKRNEWTCMKCSKKHLDYVSWYFASKLHT